MKSSFPLSFGQARRGGWKEGGGEISSNFSSALRHIKTTIWSFLCGGVCGLSTQGYKCNKGIIALFLVSHLGMWVGVDVFENKTIL